MTELIDNTKSTSKHLSCIQRDYIMSEATEQMKQYGIWKKAINSVSDSVFALFKESIAKPGRIRFDRYSEESSSCFNKHFNRGHKDFINGRRKNRINKKDIVVVLLRNIPEWFWDCLVTDGAENTNRECKCFDDYIPRRCNWFHVWYSRCIGSYASGTTKVAL